MTVTASGRIMLVIERASVLELLWLRMLLRLKYGFRHQGQRILGAGEAAFPDFVKGNMRLLAGYDDLVGFTLHSESAGGDEFLSSFGKRYAQQKGQHRLPGSSSR